MPIVRIVLIACRSFAAIGASGCAPPSNGGGYDGSD